MDEEKIEAIARIAHETNRAYCKSLGDDSQLPWDQAPEWQRQSAITGVRVHLAQPRITPAESHAAWLETKLHEGWRYGEVKDIDAKLHPCILPYEDLPQVQRAKDYLFGAIVREAALLVARWGT